MHIGAEKTEALAKHHHADYATSVMKLHKVEAVLQGFNQNAFGGDAGQQQKADDGVVDAQFTRSQR